MSTGPAEKLYMAMSVDDAVAALAQRGGEGAALAGATWIMRAPIRGEELRPFYVSIGGIAELRRVEVADDEIRIGACSTHVALIAALAGIEECSGLVAAAVGAANPAVRQMATIGGNLCASDFPASDLVPALLCLDATVEVRTPDGPERVSLGRFLEIRRDLAPGTLLTKIVIQRGSWHSRHMRLPLRKAGDYPVAILSMAATFAGDGSIEDIRVAVGSVEARARRWPELEARLRGRNLDPAEARDLAIVESNAFVGRDGIEAPGWYRVQVLPSLVRRAAEALTSPQQSVES